jgi:uncharacterized protein (UPF0261 family)
MEFVQTLKKNINARIHIVEVDAHINDEAFAQAVCSTLLTFLGEG